MNAVMRRRLEMAARVRDGARRAPDVKLSAPLVVPDAEVNAGAFDGGGEAGEDGRIERQRALDEERVAGRGGRQKGERDFGDAAFLASEARPEGGADDALDGGGVGPSGAQVMAEVLRDGVGDGGGRLVGEAFHLRKVTCAALDTATSVRDG